MADNHTKQVAGIGDVDVLRLVNGEWVPGVVEGVWYIPGFHRNSISIGQITSKGIRAEYESDRVTLSRGGEVVVVGEKLDNNTYKLFMKTAPGITGIKLGVNVAEFVLWHERFAHVNPRKMMKMAKRGVVAGLKPIRGPAPSCVGCCLGKAHRATYKETSNRQEYRVGEYFHSDLCGPMTPTSCGGARYVLTILDDGPNYRTVFFLKNKSEVFQNFKRFETLVANKFGRRMVGLRSDRGTEYVNQEMRNYMEGLGIRHDRSAPGTPEENGKAERENRTIIEAARSMLYAREAPLYLWAEAVNTAVYVLNRTSCARTGNSTPAEL